MRQAILSDPAAPKPWWKHVTISQDSFKGWEPAPGRAAGLMGRTWRPKSPNQSALPMAQRSDHQRSGANK